MSYILHLWTWAGSGPNSWRKILHLCRYKRQWALSMGIDEFPLSYFHVSAYIWMIFKWTISIISGLLWIEFFESQKEEISCEVTCTRASQLPVLKLQDQMNDLWPLEKCHFLDFRCHLCFSAHSIYFPLLSLNALFILPPPPVNIMAFYHHSKQFHNTMGISYKKLF